MTYEQVLRAWLGDSMDLALAKPEQIEQLCSDLSLDDPMTRYNEYQEELLCMYRDELSALQSL